MKRNSQSEGGGGSRKAKGVAKASSAPAALSPRGFLLPYQLKWVEDQSRFKYGLWSRQTGKDFSSGCEIVEDCLKHPKTTWLIGAAGERQALESLSKVKEWAEAYSFAIAEYTEDRAGSEALIKAGTVTWPNGSRVIAVPANPNTVRGYSANILLTEFAFLEDPDATWRAVLPSITNPLRGGEKKARIITTPNGQGNKAHELWVKNFKGNAPLSPAQATAGAGPMAGAGPKMVWSCHKVTIHDAVAAGLPLNVEELREAINDPEGWAQEFECEFLDQSSVLLPYELIATCESVEATKVIGQEWWGSSKSEVGSSKWLTMGIDFGRKKDLTVAWTNEHVGDVLHTREVLELGKMSTPDQVRLLSPRIARCQRVCLDYTGPGVGLGDWLVEKFQEWKPEQDKFGKIELCNFTNPFKQEIFPKLRIAFEERKLRIPVDRVIREDLHAISRVVTQGGLVTYKAPHTEDGHSDRATALALAVRAAGTQSGFMFAPVAVPRRSGSREVEG